MTTMRSLTHTLTRLGSRLVRRVWIGRVPKLFDSSYYLRQNSDVAASGIDPYLHYVWRGASQNRDPAEDFDTAFLRSQSGPTRLDPIRHYLRVGVSEGLDPNPGFSSSAYLTRYPDVAALGVNPLLHYRTNGRREGREAGRFSDSTGGEIAALRSVPSRCVLNLPADGDRPFSITLTQTLPDDAVAEPAARQCVLLKLDQDEIPLLVDALEAILAGGRTTVILDIAREKAPGPGAARKDKQPVSVNGQGGFSTLLAAFEHCHVCRTADRIRIRYAELRLWDLRQPTARVAEIYPAGCAEFRF